MLQSDPTCGHIYWFRLRDGSKVLVRAIAVTRMSYSLRILSITPEQVLIMNYGAGETIHVASLREQLEKVA